MLAVRNERHEQLGFLLLHTLEYRLKPMKLVEQTRSIEDIYVQSVRMWSVVPH